MKSLGEQMRDTVLRLSASIRQVAKDKAEVAKGTQKLGEQLTKVSDDMFVIKNIK